MALKKAIKQSDGITTSYHRIFYIESVINQNTAIVVSSYIDKDVRDEETPDNDIYHKCITYNTDYKENMTVEEAYDYLKTLEEFEGAEDV